MTPKGGLEGDLAIHGARGDGRDLVLEADFGGKLVDAFLADHGRIHVGDQKLLAPRLRVLHREIDRRIAEDGEDRVARGGKVAVVAQRDIAGDAVGKPVEAGGLHLICGLFGKGGRQNRI